MRRHLLTLTIVSLAGWSQTAPQQPQTPIVVQVRMPPAPSKGFLDYCQQAGPLFAALAALGVGFTQWCLQKQHLRQNMFEKRFRVYASAGEFLSDALNASCELHPVSAANFHASVAHAEFLFPSEVRDFLDEIINKSGVLALVTTQVREIADATERFNRHESDTVPPRGMASLNAQKVELERWLIQAQECRNQVFGPYLQLDQDLPWYARLERYMDDLLERLDRMLNRRKPRIES